MRKHLISTFILTIAAASAGLAQAATPVKTAGGMLVNSNGMTLYTFDNDAAGSGKASATAHAPDSGHRSRRPRTPPPKAT